MANTAKEGSNVFCTDLNTTLLSLITSPIISPWVKSADRSWITLKEPSGPTAKSLTTFTLGDSENWKLLI